MERHLGERGDPESLSPRWRVIRCLMAKVECLEKQDCEAEDCDRKFKFHLNGKLDTYFRE